VKFLRRIRKDLKLNSDKNWFFRCHYCSVEGYPHYHRSVAAHDRLIHMLREHPELMFHYEH
jgi:hypothetical protein